MTRIIYGGALWKLGDKDDAISQYVLAAQETTEADAGSWIPWITAAAALNYQDQSSYDAIAFAKKALKSEPKILSQSFQRAN